MNQDIYFNLIYSFVFQVSSLKNGLSLLFLEAIDFIYSLFEGTSRMNLSSVLSAVEATCFVSLYLKRMSKTTSMAPSLFARSLLVSICIN